MTNAAIRVFVVFVAAAAAFLFTYWVPFSLILPGDGDAWIPLVGSLAVSLLVARFLWRRTHEVGQGVVGHIVSGAFVVGGFGFAAGFVGPLVFTPDANQGPLLGLFVTGPLGFALGAVGGAVHWMVVSRRRGPEPRG
jgi:hypothetical protein